MDAKNLRRKSLAMESLCNAPPPETLTEGLRLVCLTAPLIEAMDPMHDFLSESLSASASGIDDARREVEAAQPPLLRLAASEHPAHQEALRRSGKALKKQCQLAAKDAFTKHRLAAEASVARSLAAARRARSNDALFGALARDRRRDVAGGGHARGGSAPTPRGVRGRRRSPGGAHAHARREALGVGGAPRAIGQDARELAAANADVERLQRRGGEMDAERERATAALEEARLAAAEEGVDAADGGASARAAAAARVRAPQPTTRAAGDELAVLNRGAVATRKSHRRRRRRTDASRRATVPRGGGRGDGRGARDAGGIVGGDARGEARLPPPCRGRRRAWSEAQAGGVRGGRHRRAATRRAGAETRGKDARGGGGCRSAFPRVARVRCTAGGDLELSFVDFAAERKIDVALGRARRGYGGGGTHAARDDRAPR